MLRLTQDKCQFVDLTLKTNTWLNVEDVGTTSEWAWKVVKGKVDFDSLIYVLWDNLNLKSICSY